eukprot:TRINITY_DN6034_c0_g1_i1.p1 TRINITY_DN6034_c0_g1~~TRINITY_DN6034_c0_g1_i1.p1  ORF type:complete len:477 (+),score=123.88 TRINITY_DN6034_c0_g1_i1:98-1528(+)
MKTGILSFLIISFVFLGAYADISVYQTAKGTPDKLSEKSKLTFSSFSSKTDVVLKVNHEIEHQKILGFGGAFTEAAGIVLKKMPLKLQKEVIEAYYGKDGINYSTGRVHMNSCDFSTGNYNYDDVDGDFELTHFNLTQPDLKYVVPYVKAAMKHSKHPLRMFFSPWSSPGWMKESGVMFGADEPITDALKQDESYHKAWALYFSKFIEAYQKHGINFWGLTVQNEPLGHPRWERLYFDIEMEKNFIKNHLGPLMRSKHPWIKIMMYDYHKLPLLSDWTKGILGDPESAQYVDGVGVHWYRGPHFEVLDEVARDFPETFVLATEATMEHGVKLANFSSGEKYGYDILGDLAHNVVGWTDWNIVLDQNGGPNHVGNVCDAPIICDTEKKKLYYQYTYYFMGHFSKFIEPGSKRVELEITSSPAVEVLSVAFHVDTNVVIVIMNRSEKEMSYEIHDPKEGYATTTLMPHSIQTLVYSTL